MPGTLFVIATPLGNLEDLSPRAARTLREVACIACEDTRRTARLLARFGIETPTVSCHRFNEHERLEPLLERLARGDDVGLVSDAGTPGVSDPGALLVRAALDRAIDVRPVPGPSAAAALLSASGMPADRYVFEGFLPQRGGERRRRLRELCTETRTLVLFEAPHRIHATLEDIEEVFGPRPLTLGRELTKVHETILRGSPGEVAARLPPDARGEITLVLGGAAPGSAVVESRAAEARTRWRQALEDAGGDRRLALKQAARSLGMKRSELQRCLDELEDRPPHTER